MRAITLGLTRQVVRKVPFIAHTLELAECSGLSYSIDRIS